MAGFFPQTLLQRSLLRPQRSEEGPRSTDAPIARPNDSANRRNSESNDRIKPGNTPGSHVPVSKHEGIRSDSRASLNSIPDERQGAVLPVHTNNSAADGVRDRGKGRAAEGAVREWTRDLDDNDDDHSVTAAPKRRRIDSSASEALADRYNGPPTLVGTPVAPPLEAQGDGRKPPMDDGASSSTDYESDVSEDPSGVDFSVIESQELMRKLNAARIKFDTYSKKAMKASQTISTILKHMAQSDHTHTSLSHAEPTQGAFAVLTHAKSAAAPRRGVRSNDDKGDSGEDQPAARVADVRLSDAPRRTAVDRRAASHGSGVDVPSVGHINNSSVKAASTAPTPTPTPTVAAGRLTGADSRPDMRGRGSSAESNVSANANANAGVRSGRSSRRSSSPSSSSASSSSSSSDNDDDRGKDMKKLADDLNRAPPARKPAREAVPHVTQRPPATKTAPDTRAPRPKERDAEPADDEDEVDGGKLVSVRVKRDFEKRFFSKKPRNLIVLGDSASDIIIASSLDGSISFRRISVTKREGRRRADEVRVIKKESLRTDKWAEDMAINPQRTTLALAFKVPSQRHRLALIDIRNGMPSENAYKFLSGDAGTDLCGVVRFCTDGTSLVTGCPDRRVLLWNADKYDQPCVLHSGHTAEVTSLCCASDGDSVISGGRDGKVLLYSLRAPGSGTRMIARFENTCHSILECPTDPNILLLGCTRQREQFTLKDLRMKETVRVFGFEEESNISQYMFPSWKPDGTLVTCGDFSGNVHFFDIRSTQSAIVRMHGKRVQCAEWHPRRNRLFTVSSDLALGIHSISIVRE